MTSGVANPDELFKDIENPGHTNWDPFEFLKNLLIEVENGILISEVHTARGVS